MEAVFFRRFWVFLFLIFGLVPSLFAQENDVESILNEVVRHLSRRDFSSALAQFDRMRSEDAQRVEILVIRASILNSAGRTAEARTIANNILSVRPDYTDALMILADAAAIEGRDRDRRTALERVISIDPNNARALNDLANISLGNQNLRVAAGILTGCLPSSLTTERRW